MRPDSGRGTAIAPPLRALDRLNGRRPDDYDPRPSAPQRALPPPCPRTTGQARARRAQASWPHLPGRRTPHLAGPGNGVVMGCPASTVTSAADTARSTDGAATDGGHFPSAQRGEARPPALRPPSGPAYQHTHRWPLRSVLLLEAVPISVPRARAHTGQVLSAWGHGLGRLDGIDVVVSELVSNAVQASAALPAAPPVKLALISDGARVLVLVGDHSTCPPRPAAPGPGELSGRGLLLVEACSASWGWFPAVGLGWAKVVWAAMAPP
jgi:anti-sigma regulatory factor (Ser/Thr protein kinase)